MSGDTAELVELAAKRTDALKAAKMAGLAGDDGPALELAGIEDGERIAADAEADAAAMIDAAKTGRELADVLAALAPAGDGPRIAAVTLDTATDPPRREWLAGDDSMGWLPAGRVALLTGEGGAGKSRLALQLAAAVAGGGRDVLPSTRPGERADEDSGPVIASAGAPRPVAVIGWEDEADEARRRLRWIAAAGIAAAGNTGGRLHYLDAGADGPMWASPERFAAAGWTGFGDGARAWLASIDGLALVVLDPLAAVFGANENDRGEVRRFLAALNAWAAETGPAVLVVAHPPKTGASYSGSTDWRNGVRALWTLTTEAVGGYEQPGDGKAEARGRCLTLDKASYGRDGARAWLKLHAANGPDGRTGALAWQECTAQEAIEDRAGWKGLDPPERKPDMSEKRANGRTGYAAPGEL